MLEVLVVLLYISGMTVTAGAIYGTADETIHPVKASLAIVLWPVIPFAICAVMTLEYVRETFR